MDEGDVQRWFAAYQEFVALGRGDVDDVARLLAHYAVPLVLSSPGGTTALTDQAAIAAITRQIEGMRAAGFAATEVLGDATTVLNDGELGAGGRGSPLTGRLDGARMLAVGGPRG